MLNWDQTQILKLYVSSTPEEWDAIPGMIPRGTWTSGENGQAVRVPGTFDSTYDLPAKFPKFKELKDAEQKQRDINKPSTWERDLGGLMEEGQAIFNAIGTGLQTPFKMAGYFIPDYIGPAGGVEVAGVPFPSRISLKSLGAPVRAITKAVTTGFVSAADFTKSNFEYAMTHPGELSSLGVNVSVENVFHASSCSLSNPVIATVFTKSPNSRSSIFLDEPSGSKINVP